MGLDTTWKLRVSVGELHEWKQRSAADGKLLSAWIRELCNAEIEDHRVPPVREDREVRAAKGRESPADGVPERTDLDVTSSKDAAIGKVSLPIRQVPRCEHGTEKGYHCWQCGGLAKVGGKHD